MQFLEESLVELITQTSTNLPPDVRQAIGAPARYSKYLLSSQPGLHFINGWNFNLRLPADCVPKMLTQRTHAGPKHLGRF